MGRALLLSRDTADAQVWEGKLESGLWEADLLLSGLTLQRCRVLAWVPCPRGASLKVPPGSPVH